MKKSGFTLIEFSIVIVIVGLIIGGVMIGNDLVKSAELRSAISNIEQYDTAMSAFELKYNCIPGDCANATEFFGALTNQNYCTDVSYWNSNSQGYTSGTCNGNGDSVYPCTNGGNSAVCTSTTAERYYIFHHLQLAGFADGYFIRGRSFMYGNPGVSVRNAVLSFGYYPSGSSNAYTAWPATFDKNMFVLYSEPSPYSAVLKAKDAHSIDNKIDDGKPGSGMVVAGYYSNGPQVNKATGSPASGYASCGSTNTASTATYVVTSDLLACNMAFIND